MQALLVIRTFELHLLIKGLLLPYVSQPFKGMVPDETLVLIFDVIIDLFKVPVKISNLRFRLFSHKLIVPDVSSEVFLNFLSCQKSSLLNKFWDDLSLFI